MLDLIIFAENLWEKPTMFGVPFGTLMLIFWVVSQLKAGNQQQPSSRASLRSQKQSDVRSNDRKTDRVVSQPNSQSRNAKRASHFDMAALTETFESEENHNYSSKPNSPSPPRRTAKKTTPPLRKKATKPPRRKP